MNVDDDVHGTVSGGGLCAWAQWAALPVNVNVDVDVEMSLHWPFRRYARPCTG